MATGWWAENFATGNSALAKLVTDAVGQLGVEAVVETELAKLVNNASGWMDPRGEMATTLAKLVSGGVGGQAQAGAIATALPAPTTAAAGDVGDISGVVATVLGALSNASSGTAAFPEVVQVYTSGGLAAVAGQAFPTGWQVAGTGVWVKGIGAGGRGNAGGPINSGYSLGGAGGAGFDEVFISKAAILAAGSTFSAKYGIGGNDTTDARHTEFAVGSAILLRAGGANGTAVGTCTVTGVAGVSTYNGMAPVAGNNPGTNSTGPAGASGGNGGSAPGGSQNAGTKGGDSATRTGGAGGTAAGNGATPPDAAVLDGGAGGGGGSGNAITYPVKGGNGAKGGKFGGGGGGAGSGWDTPGTRGDGGDGGLRLRWV